MQTPTDRARGKEGRGASWGRLVMRHSSGVSCDRDRPETRRGASCGGRNAAAPARASHWGEHDYSGWRRQRIGRVARVLAGFIRSCLPSVVVFLVSVVLSRRVPRTTSVFCLNSTVSCAMLSPSASCAILHKSSVSPRGRRTLPANHPIDAKGGLNVEDSSVPTPT